MALQDTYSEGMRPGLPGLVANETNWDADTCNCETAAGIGFGLACGLGAADGGAVLGGALAIFAGISVRDVTLEAADADKYVLNKNMAVLTEGDIWVTTGGAVVKGNPVHYSSTTGVLSASGGSGPIVGARWMTSAASGALARVRLGGGLPAA